MATIDIRGASVSSADPPIATNPNPDLAWKAPVRVATTGSNITLSGLQTLDGIALTAGDRVLVKDQTDATTNGLYNAATGQWTRTIDAQGNSQFADGLQVMVTGGAINGGFGFQLTTANPITLGTSELTFVTSVIGFGVAAANVFFAGPSTGSPAAPSFRVIALADLPSGITNALLAAMAAATVKGSVAGGLPADLTMTQLTALLNQFTSSLQGLVPASGGGSTNFLRADGLFTAPGVPNQPLQHFMLTQLGVS